MTRKKATISVGRRVRYDGEGVQSHYGELIKLFMGQEWIGRVSFDEGLIMNCRIQDLTVIDQLPGAAR